MLIKILVPMSGPLFNLDNGDVYDFDEAEAQRIVEAGFGVPAATSGKETTTKKAPAEIR